MNKQDKREIEKLKGLKKEYYIVCNLSKEERVKRFCKAMIAERRKKMNKADYFVSIQYAKQSIEFWIQLPSNTDLEKFNRELREELCIEIEKEEG